MKIAIEVTLILKRTVVLEADDYETAVQKVTDAYNQGELLIDPTNASESIECSNETDDCINTFGSKKFEEMEVSEEFAD